MAGAPRARSTVGQQSQFSCLPRAQRRLPLRCREQLRLDNFSAYWEKCGDAIETQSELISQLVERVYIEDKTVVAMTLRSNCHLILGHKVNEPTEYTVDPFLYQSGSDGSRIRTGTHRKLCLSRYILRTSTLRYQLTRIINNMAQH